MFRPIVASLHLGVYAEKEQLVWRGTETSSSILRALQECLRKEMLRLAGFAMLAPTLNFILITGLQKISYT